MLGSLLLNIFFKHVFLWLKNSDLHNFVDDSTNTVTYNSFTSLCQTLEKESESAIDWLQNNSMITNPDKLQATILSKDATDITHKLKTYNNETETTKSVKLLKRN